MIQKLTMGDKNMNRKFVLKILFIILCFVSAYNAKSQVNISWGDPRRDDTVSVMVLDVYDIKNVKLFPILDIAMNMSNFFEFGNDTTLNIFYTISIKAIENNKIRIFVYPSQTSEIVFHMLWGYGKMPNGMLIYKNMVFLIKYWQKDSIAAEFIDKNFVITDKKSILKKDPRNPKYMTGNNSYITEGFSLEFETDASFNNIRLIKAEINSIEIEK
jgi:hypothetical protein